MKTIKKTYNLLYEFGVHHIFVEVSEVDFNKVIDDLSMEFTIYKDWENEDFKKTIYKIENYYGDLQTVGFIQETVEDIFLS